MADNNTQALETAKGLATLKDYDLSSLTPDQTAVIKNTVAKGTTDTELSWFLYQASVMKLNPLMEEILVCESRERFNDYDLTHGSIQQSH